MHEMRLLLLLHVMGLRLDLHPLHHRIRLLLAIHLSHSCLWSVSWSLTHHLTHSLTHGLLVHLRVHALIHSLVHVLVHGVVHDSAVTLVHGLRHDGAGHLVLVHSLLLVLDISCTWWHVMLHLRPLVLHGVHALVLRLHHHLVLTGLLLLLLTRIPGSHDSIRSHCPLLEHVRTGRRDLSRICLL